MSDWLKDYSVPLQTVLRLQYRLEHRNATLVRTIGSALTGRGLFGLWQTVYREWLALTWPDNQYAAGCEMKFLRGDGINPSD
jgi:hypothetical protein